MIKSYLKTAFRNISANKTFSIINILGLSAGISVCLLIFIFIYSETGYDGFHSKKNQIYRVLTEYHHSKELGTFYGAEVPQPLPSIIKTDLPEIESSAGVFASTRDQIFILDNNGAIVKKIRENTGVFAMEPAFFKIFDFPWLAGDPNSSLNEPNSVVLSKETAIKYFGDWRAAMGKTIRMNNVLLLKVTGILSSIPVNTDFQIKVVIPFNVLGLTRSSDWENASDRFGCYVLLPPHVTQTAVTARLRALSKKYRPAGNTNELVLQSIKDVHYYDSHSQIRNFLGRTISLELIHTLWIVAAFILFIACINFINLSTAQAVRRAKEIGVRKVLGCTKVQLKTQFLTETLLLVVCSVILSVAITLLSISPLNRLLELHLSPTVFKDLFTILFLISLTIIVTLFAGFYPSIVLSAFNPIQVLKSRFDINKGKVLSLRRGLVVLQFIIAQVIIISMVVLTRQMDYLINTPMGFDKDAIVMLHIPWDKASKNKIDYLRNRLTALPGVKDVSFNSNPPATSNNFWCDFYLGNTHPKDVTYAILKCADAHYVKTYDIPLAAGRNFTSDTAHEFLINQKMLGVLGFPRPEDALNKQLSIGDNSVRGPIVGVLKDFHSGGLKESYSPVFITAYKDSYNMAAVKLNSDHVSLTIKAIETLWNQTYPDYIFEYEFVDETIGEFYKQEKQQTQLFKILAMMAIFLGCLGLYGLISFMVTQKIKEVGVRKILGASIGNILYLFSKEFLLLISVAFLIASPIAWYFMHQWLANYAYRVEIGVWTFIVSGMASILIAMATISVKAIKAALANPVNSLRSE